MRESFDSFSIVFVKCPGFLRLLSAKSEISSRRIRPFPSILKYSDIARVLNSPHTCSTNLHLLKTRRAISKYYANPREFHESFPSMFFKLTCALKLTSENDSAMIMMIKNSAREHFENVPVKAGFN